MVDFPNRPKCVVYPRKLGTSQSPKKIIGEMSHEPLEAIYFTSPLREF